VRWDPDERGHGISDASALAPGVQELGAATAIEDWVAEEPEAHLLPHIRRACDALAIELVGHETVDSVLVVKVAAPEERTAEAVFWIIGSFAEWATSIRRRGSTTFEIVTGMLDGDSQFTPHGHMVRIELVPPA
jgi:hypothetical protein